MILVKFVDVFRNLYIASLLGVSDSADIYIGIISIPDSLLILVGLDSLRGVINSEYSKLNAIGKQSEIFQSYKNLLAIVFLLSIIFVILSYTFDKQLLGILLPGFTDEKQTLALSMFQIILPIFIFKALLSVLTSLFNSFKKFNIVSFSPIIISIIILISIQLPPIHYNLLFNLSYANLAGNAVLLVVLYILSRGFTSKTKMNLNLFDPLTITIIKNCASIFLLVLMNQIYLSSRNFYVSYFGDGAISSLNYASSIPVFISTFTFSVIFGILLVELSSGKNLQKRSENKKKYLDTFLNLMFVYAPLIVWMIICSKEILNILYLRGNFTEKGILTTSLPFNWEVLGLFSFLLYTIPTALFLANKKYVLLSKIGIVVYAFGIVLNFILTKIVGFYGVSISGFIVSLVYGILLIYFSQSLIGSLKVFLKLTFKIILSAIFVFGIVYVLKYNLLNLLISQGNQFTDVANGITVLFLIILLYIPTTIMLKLDFFKKIIKQFRGSPNS